MPTTKQMIKQMRDDEREISFHVIGKMILDQDSSSPTRSDEVDIAPDIISPPGKRMRGINHVNKDKTGRYVRCIQDGTGGMYFRRSYFTIPVDNEILAMALAKELTVLGWNCDIWSTSSESDDFPSGDRPAFIRINK